MEKISITKLNLPISEFQRIIKYSLSRGRVIPHFKFRSADLLCYVYKGDAVYHFGGSYSVNDEGEDCGYRFEGGYNVTVHGGDVLYIPKGSSYYYDVISEEYEYIYADIIFAYPDGYEGKGESFEYKGLGKPIQNLFENMNLKWLTKPKGYYQECMSGIYTVYAKLMQSYDAKYVNCEARKVPDKCAVHIQQNYADPDFSVGQLEKIAGCSSVHLRRIFNDCFGMSPCDYLTHIRIENAKALLENTEYNIAKISEAVGYKDAYYFSRVFRKEVGCSPSEYRKSLSR